MSIKTFLAKKLANYTAKKLYNESENAVKIQQKILQKLLKTAKDTTFGIDHKFEYIFSYKEFKSIVTIRDYEGLKHYVDDVVKGKEDVLWPGKPLYFAKTSGTTSGTKYIPLTKESMPTHISAARNALLMHIYNTKNADFLKGKMIFLQGSPELKIVNGIKTGRLSGIAAHYVPSYLLKNRLPSWETNCINDWEIKVDAIVEETSKENMTLISGIPSWVQMYFEKLVKKTGKSVSELFPNFNLYLYGGVNFEPYRKNFENLIGKQIPTVELYPASEGFFAIQDSLTEEGMLLLVNNGMFYEFIPSDEFYNENPTRISLADVKLGINYVLILSTNAGLWGYNIGDTIQFVSLKPYRIIVSGRIKHFISAFGEHVIGNEVEKALHQAMKKTNISVNEFTVAPQITPEKGLPYHEWFIEFEQKPTDLAEFSLKIDEALQKQNSYYFDLIDGKILKQLQIICVQKNGFNKYMKSIGKLGGQNKVPRLSNDRKIADELYKFQEK